MQRVESFVFLALHVIMIVFLAEAVWGQDLAAIERGKYIFAAAGGCGCHTDLENKGPFMAGGRPIQTPFGKVYSTNITPDLKTGIGRWSTEQFIRAMTKGVGPRGQHYFPVFPYTSFTKMTRRDLVDLQAYLMSIPAIKNKTRPPEIKPPFSWRWGVAMWKWLYFTPGTFRPDASRSSEWNRGAYLAIALAHCGECHTPRNVMGGLKTGMYYAGTVAGPGGELAPNITPDETTGIGDWSIEDVVWFLQTGLKPNGDDVQGSMSELIEQGYAKVSEADLRAIAVYLRSLTPIHNKVEPSK